MKLRKVLFGIVAAIPLALWGCAIGAGVGPVHGGHHGPSPATDHYDVQYQAYDTVKTVRCPVCGGAGTLQKVYHAHPSPAYQHMSP